MAAKSIATSESEAPTTPRTRRRPERLVVKRDPVSFITHTRTSRGRYVADNYFDVPAEEYGAGNLTGLRVAAEFMQAIKEGHLASFMPLDVIRGAAKALEEDAQESRRGAAVGFLRTLEEIVVHGAKSGLYQDFIERRIAQHLKYDREYAARRQKAGAEFSRRMEIAKAAKARAKREASHA